MNRENIDMNREKKIKYLISYVIKNTGKYPTKDENKRMYSVITNLRTKRKMGQLSDNHLEMLKSIRFEFNVQDQKWYSHFNQLKDFMIDNHGKLPSMVNKKRLKAYDSVKGVWVDEDRKKEYLIGNWLSTQRELMKNGAIKDYRKKLIESAGISIDGYKSKWEDKYYEIYDCVNQKGSLPNVKENAKLHNWFYRNLKLYDNMGLTGKHLQLFEALIIILPKGYRKKITKTWNERYDELNNFLTDYGRLPKSYRKLNSKVKDENELSKWLSGQKVIGRKNKLPKDKYLKLENLGVEIKPINHEKDWLEKYMAYCDFINKRNREPKLNCKSDYETRLSQWVNYNRNLFNGKFKNRELPNNRYLILKNINFKF